MNSITHPILRRVRRALHKPGPDVTDLTRDVRRRLPKERFRTLFDVGANHGQSAKEFAKAYPEAIIYSFEPDPSNFVHLRASAGPRTRPFNLGLGATSGTFRFDNTSENDMMRHIASDQDNSDLPAIQFSTVDQFCSGNKITAIDFLKIDTEGHDLEVIKGADRMLRSGAIGLLMAEVSMSADNAFHVAFSEVHPHLEERGYRLFGVYEQVHEWRTRKPSLRRANVAYISPAVISRNTGAYTP